MLYTISKTEQLTSKKNTPFWKCEVMDTNGQLYQNVTSFSAVIDGKQVDGFLERNDYNGKEGYILKQQEAVRTGGKVGQMTAVMEKKQEGIERSMDRKEESIALAGSIRDAVVIVNRLVEAGAVPANEQDIKIKIREWVHFFQTLHENPNQLPPSSNGL